MKCKCGNTLTGRQREFCSDKCRKRTSRTEPGFHDAPQSTNADKMVVERGQTEPGQRTRTVPIPGDPGYVGVCEEVDGVWRVKPDIQPAPVASLSDLDLQLRLKSYEGASWVGSPEHKEVLSRREVMV